MKTTPVMPEDLCGVFAVPPLARSNDGARALDFEQNDLIVRHIAGGGITRFLYGGNAFLHHVSLTEYEQMLEWLSGFAGDWWAIPSAGPSFGRALDQARLLRKYKFPCVMMLPCGDPRDAAGLEQGYREIAAAAETQLIVYLKEELNFGARLEAGLDAVARLVNDGVCVGIKYAVVRQNPAVDQYLQALLERVDRRWVISGIGERPAVSHLRDWKLPGFTTGSGCLAPHLSQQLYEAGAGADFEKAESLRTHFIPLEDLRDAWSPAKVLHHATELGGIASTGALPPYLSALPADQQQRISPVAKTLIEHDRK
ncbi:MAG TPA: dihydrodipicolinate synthase family protein [Blastocatellia bacterium]|nr:dihydrodipicolinate synthase family protein [Blastocatellia bacterium]